MNPERPVPLVSVAKLAQLALPDLLDPLDPRDLQVNEVQLERGVNLELQEHQVRFVD